MKSKTEMAIDRAAAALRVGTLGWLRGAVYAALDTCYMTACCPLIDQHASKDEYRTWLVRWLECVNA